MNHVTASWPPDWQKIQSQQIPRAAVVCRNRMSQVQLLGAGGTGLGQMAQALQGATQECLLQFSDVTPMYTPERCSHTTHEA
jgi:hypothetical protein